jgi:hypothetical protein
MGNLWEAKVMGTKKGQPRKTARRAYMKKKKKKKGFFDFDLPDALEDITPKMNFYRSKAISKDRKKGGQ